LIVLMTPVSADLIAEWAEYLVRRSTLARYWGTAGNAEDVLLLIMQFCISNVLIMAAGVIAAAAARLFALLGKAGSKKQVTGIMSRFYKYDQSGLKLAENERGVNMRHWSAALQGSFLILAAAENIFLLACLFAKGFLPEAAGRLAAGVWMAPAYGFMAASQLLWLFDGDPEDSQERGLTGRGGESIKDRLQALLGKYREAYDSSSALIGHQDLHFSEDGGAPASENLWQNADSGNEEILEILIRQAEEVSGEENASYRYLLSCLLQERSVYVSDRPDGMLLPYLAAYMNFFVSQKKTFLILCRNRRSAKRIREKLSECGALVNLGVNICRISDTDGMNSGNDTDILVCAWGDLAEYSLMAKNQEFFDDLSAILFADTMEFCALENPEKERVFAELHKIQKKICYIVIAEDGSENLRAAFEYFTGRNLEPVTADRMPEDVCVLVWREDSWCKIQRCIGLGGAGSPYTGLAVPLSLTALRCHEGPVRIFSDGQAGFRSYREAMNGYSKEITRYLGAELLANDNMLYNEVDSEHEQDLQVVVIRDDAFNLYSLLWSWLKYGGRKGTLLHVISPVYMLREFFADRLHLLHESSDYSALAGYRSGMEHTRLLSILLQISNTGMTVEELMQKNQEYSLGCRNAEEILTKALRSVLHDQEYYNLYEYFLFKEGEEFDPDRTDFVQYTKVTLHQGAFRDRICTLLAFASLVTDQTQDTVLPIYAENISNYFLRGQIVPIGGYTYHISNIIEGRIYAEKYPAEDRKEYYAASEFVIEDTGLLDELTDLEQIDFNRRSANVTRMIYGFWESNRGVDLARSGAMNFHLVWDSIPGRMAMQPQIVERQNVQVLEIRLRRDALSRDNSRADAAGRLFAFMIDGLMKTLFPCSYMNMFTVVEMPEDPAYWSTFLGGTQNADIHQKLLSIQPFVRRDPAQMSGDFLSIYVVEFSHLEMGMIMSFYSHWRRVFSMMKNYLEWYLDPKQRTGKITPSYLNLGFGSTPDVFAPQELLEFLRRILPSYE
ncbi:MAG: hypothetical protein K6C06_08000, partial [Lachnospiraceae bacterium]|nr:hypothetical protein [Lachnospiraceae bacterium]